MKYMLDTNICIYAIKKNPSKVYEKIRTHSTSEICISSITYAELMHGVEKSAYPVRNRFALSLFLAGITVLDFNIPAADKYGLIRTELEKKGTPIGPLDSMIAGHALSESCILVTNNEREFRRIDGLSIENWA